MVRFDSPLNNIKIASPCSADWDEMYGDNRKRFCGECKLSVYNLSGMTQDEAETLIMNAEGRLCVRYYMRRDGSIITQDCPVGWAKVKQRTKLFATAVASLVIALFTGALFVSLFSKGRSATIMGDIAIPFVTPSPTPDGRMGGIRPMPQQHTTGMVALPETTPADRFEMGKIRVLSEKERKALRN